MHLPLQHSLLRPWRMEDLPALVKHANNQNISANLRDGFPWPYTEAHGYHWISMAMEKPWMLAIECNGEACGGIGMEQKTDVHRFTCEMGYWLAEPLWGRGIMTEAVIAFSNELFRHTAIVRIEATPYSHNPASARVLEKAGFSLESIQKRAVYKRNEFLDLLVYVRLRF